MLSIIIPTYNEERFLPLLLTSIKAQENIDFEIIVADNHSTDSTREIAKKAGAIVVDGGMPGPGRNRGAEVAKGEVLLFLDADVILPDPQFLHKTVGEFLRRQLGLATCKLTALSDKKIDQISHGIFNYFMWATSSIMPHAPGFCIFALKSVHEQIHGFDESIKLLEDHDYAFRASKVGKFGLLKTSKIPVSVRRFDRDGRLNVFAKYILSEFYVRAKGGIRSDVFNYTFGHDSVPETEEVTMKKLDN